MEVGEEEEAMKYPCSKERGDKQWLKLAAKWTFQSASNKASRDFRSGCLFLLGHVQVLEMTLWRGI